jgi:hypothetical protein
MPSEITTHPDACKAFIQYIMTVGVAREQQVKKQTNAIAELFELADPGPDDWRRLIAAANKVLQFVQLTIRATVSEINSNIYWGITNTANDELSKISGVFPAKEVKYFQELIKELINAKGQLSSQYALDIRPTEDQHRIHLNEARFILAKFCKYRWLKADKDGNYLIGERTYLELSPYFDRLRDEGKVGIVLCKLELKLNVNAAANLPKL